MKGQTALEQGLQRLMNGVVVAIQQVDAGADLRLDPPHHGKIMAALDPVVTVEMLQERLQRRDQRTVQGDEVAVRPPLADEAVHMGLVSAKTAVHLQPEGGGLVERGVPAVARVFVQQIAETGREACPRGEGVRQPRWSS